MKIVIFEGVDRGGKTTLARAFNKVTDFRHIVVDRMFVSQAVYGYLYNRRTDMDDLKRMFEANKQDILIVHVVATAEDISKRLEATNHEKIDIYEHQNMFTEVINIFSTSFKANICEVDTSEFSEEQNLARIIAKIEEMETAL